MDDTSTCIAITQVASTLGEDRGSTPRRNMHEAREGCVLIVSFLANPHGTARPSWQIGAAPTTHISRGRAGRGGH